MGLNIGAYEIRQCVTDHFRLDGGAMFGSVPKNLWSKKIEPDNSNRIQMCSRSLLLESSSERIVIDLGCGNFWNEKEREIFCFESHSLNEIKNWNPTHIILTHLHFDHAGGIVDIFPSAEVILSRSNFDRALHPSVRERASYRKEILDALEKHRLTFIDQASEIFPGIFVSFSEGHTAGLLQVRIEDDTTRLFFPSDLIPMSHHLQVPYLMGNDLHAAWTVSEKEDLFSQLRTGDIIVFEHDSLVAAVKVMRDENQNLKFIATDIPL